jgi:hypothetical protein
LDADELKHFTEACGLRGKPCTMPRHTGTPQTADTAATLPDQLQEVENCMSHRSVCVCVCVAARTREKANVSWDAPNMPTGPETRGAHEVDGKCRWISSESGALGVSL